MMATLSKRATPQQHRVLRIIEGAVKNASDAHGIEFSLRFGRSIAKRAAGTLTAQWPDVLAAKALSETGQRAQLCEAQAHEPPQRSGVVPPQLGMAKTGRAHPTKPSPIRLLQQAIFSEMRGIKNSGNAERARAMIDVLRCISLILRAEREGGG